MPVTLDTENFPSFRRLVASVGLMRCAMSMSPERRLATRTLSSGMMRKISRSNLAWPGSK